jgi:hypothetical protein
VTIVATRQFRTSTSASPATSITRTATKATTRPLGICLKLAKITGNGSSPIELPDHRVGNIKNNDPSPIEPIAAA